MRFELSKEQFVEKMNAIVERAGKFYGMESLYVESTDAGILAGKTRDNWDKLDVMYAIGMMSEKVPTDIRRASVRGMITLEFTPEAAEQLKKQWGVANLDELYEEGEAPYCKLKTVLVEEDGELKVAYFEFVPPSMLD